MMAIILADPPGLNVLQMDGSIMAKNRFKDHQARRESGGFVAMPHAVIRSRGYAELTAHAVKLLNDLLAQYNGHNNGDLCCAWSLMQTRGWRSKSTLNRARRELLYGGWILVTRQGGRHLASLYAVTFYNIDDCGGKLDVVPTNAPPGVWKKSVVREAYQSPNNKYGTRTNYEH